MICGTGAGYELPSYWACWCPCGGCSDGGDGAGGSSAPPAVSTPAATGIETETGAPSSSPPESPYSDSDTVLMAKGDCYGWVTDNAPGRAEEMACDDSDAVGKVIKRAKEKTTQDTYIDCPDPTDDVLGISDASGPELMRLTATTPST